MKKILASVLAITLIGGSFIKVSAYENINKNDILVGYVEDQPINSSYSTVIKQRKDYTLDFSCLDVDTKNGKIITKIDMTKIKNVAQVKKFTDEKENKLIENANRTKQLLENELNDNKIHSEINEIILQHRIRTSSNPIIRLEEVNIDNNRQSNKKLPTNSLYIATNQSISGKTESNSYVRLYTSVSGSGTTAWGQSNAYIPVPSTMGVQINCPDAISLSWDSPWKLTNSYSISIIDTVGNTMSSLIKPRTRTGGSNNCLAYSYNQQNVSGAYLGASLANGTSGGHNLFSTYIHTYMTLSYSFSGSDGKAGLSVSPGLGTSSVQSSVYFTR